jgi:hypothetical protein
MALASTSDLKEHFAVDDKEATYFTPILSNLAAPYFPGT